MCIRDAACDEVAARPLPVLHPQLRAAPLRRFRQLRGRDGHRRIRQTWQQTQRRRLKRRPCLQCHTPCDTRLPGWAWNGATSSQSILADTLSDAAGGVGTDASAAAPIDSTDLAKHPSLDDTPSTRAAHVSVAAFKHRSDATGARELHVREVPNNIILGAELLHLPQTGIGRL